MNSTNRAANRLLLGITGLLLLVMGAAGVALATAPAFASLWRTRASALLRDAPAWVAAPAVGTVSALTVGVGVSAVVLAVVLVIFIVRQGRGHTASVVERRDGDSTTRIELGVPRSLLETELAHRVEFVATRVSAYRVRGTDALKVSVQCRRGIAPTDAAAIVLRALEGMDAIIGTAVPALVQVSGGFRSRAADRARVS